MNFIVRVYVMIDGKERLMSENLFHKIGEAIKYLSVHGDNCRCVLLNRQSEKVIFEKGYDE
jgi:hypothetical protein